MRDYQKEYLNYRSRCRICGEAYVKDARHVGEQGIENCIPLDNLEYLEMKLAEKEKESQ